MNNEDKILSMLETLVAEQQKTNQRLDKLEQGQSKLEQGQSKLEQDVQFIKNTVVRIENDHGRALSLLQDGYTANHELYERHELRIDKLEEGVDRLDTKVKVLNHAR